MKGGSGSDAAEIRNMFQLQARSASDVEQSEAAKTLRVVDDLCTARAAAAAEETRCGAVDADMMPSPSPAMSATMAVDAAAVPLFFLGEAALGMASDAAGGAHSGSSAAGAASDDGSEARGVPAPDYFELQFSPAFKAAGGAGGAAAGAASASTATSGGGIDDDDDEEEEEDGYDGGDVYGDGEPEEVALYWSDNVFASDIEGGMRLTLPPDMRVGDHHEEDDVADERDLDGYDVLDDLEAAVYDKMDGSLPRAARKRRQGGGSGGGGAWR